MVYARWLRRACNLVQVMYRRIPKAQKRGAVMCKGLIGMYLAVTRNHGVDRALHGAHSGFDDACESMHEPSRGPRSQMLDLKTITNITERYTGACMRANTACMAMAEEST